MSDNDEPAPIFNMRSSRNLLSIDDAETEEEVVSGSGRRSNGSHRQGFRKFRTDSERNFSGSSMREISGADRPEEDRPDPSPKKKMDPPARERPVDNVWPERDALSFTRSLVFYGNGAITPENEVACNFIIEARDMRAKYQKGEGTFIVDAFDECSEHLICKMGEDGIMGIYDESDLNFNRNLVTVPDIDEFVEDYRRLVDICADGAMRSYCFQRLQMLDSAFKMHVTANGTVENEAQSNLLGTDFYRTMKIDNHIHLAAAASANQFVNFVGEKLEKEGDTVVTDSGKTLKEEFDQAGISAGHLTIDAFNVLADYSVYQRFDNFNSKYSPFRLANIRKIFLKVENVIDGRFFAELTKVVLQRLEQSKGHNSAAEMRLSIYGMERDEWYKLAKWVLRDWGGDYPGPVLSTHNRWLVQIPRLWRIYYMKNQQSEEKKSFQDMLDNLFVPIFEATISPEKHPEVAELLTHIVGFDSVDDEGASEAPCGCTRPSGWTNEQNPAYCWQLFYLWSNMEVLNRLRKSRGLNTFAFRPHAGETGDAMHLAVSCSKRASDVFYRFDSCLLCFP
jgi:AMP deaminase